MFICRFCSLLAFFLRKIALFNKKPHFLPSRSLQYNPIFESPLFHFSTSRDASTAHQTAPFPFIATTAFHIARRASQQIGTCNCQNRRHRWNHIVVYCQLENPKQVPNPVCQVPRMKKAANGSRAVPSRPLIRPHSCSAIFGWPHGWIGLTVPDHVPMAMELMEVAPAVREATAQTATARTRCGVSSRHAHPCSRDGVRAGTNGAYPMNMCPVKVCRCTTHHQDFYHDFLVTPNHITHTHIICTNCKFWGNIQS